MSERAKALRRTRQAGSSLLTEAEGLALLESLGVSIPLWTELSHLDDLSPQVVDRFPGDLVVLKAICPDLPHKTELGAVEVVSRDPLAIASAASAMAARLAERQPSGFLLQEWVDYDPRLGGELLVNLRWDREFGPVLTCGPGGIHTELLARHLRPGRASWIASAHPDDGRWPLANLLDSTLGELLLRSQRRQPPRLASQVLTSFLQRLTREALPLLGEEIDEIEINPVVLRGEELIALDVLVKLNREHRETLAVRPVEKLKCLLEPRSIAIVGASRRLNPGRILLRNTLRQGFDPSSVFVIKKGQTMLEGCPCVGDLEDLPEPVDLLVVAISASQVPDLLERVIATRCAESLIVIPGGFEDDREGAARTRQLEDSLARARQSRWKGPLINGGNSLGIRSAPGGYDTFFLPDYKVPPPGPTMGEVALVAQSGAFLATRSSKMESLSFKYSISVGNQLDLTIGDYLEYLSEDVDLRVVAVYVEGFRALDGRRMLQAAETMVQRGQRLVLYRAGRSEEGARAAASHTASMAGSYATTAALARAAGVLVAGSMADFEDLLDLAVKWFDRPADGRRLGGFSNTGFESVAFSDGLHWLERSLLAPSTVEQLRQILASAGLSELVGIRNPLDVTPMMQDEDFARVAEAILADPGVDIAVFGCVPLTGALNTLPAGPGHGEDLDRAGGLADRLIGLWRSSSKPWVMVVDAGRIYDPLVGRLRHAGIPVFRFMDRAMEVVELYLRGTGA